MCINHNGLGQGMERMILSARQVYTTLIPTPMGHDVYSMILFFYGSDTHMVTSSCPVGFCRVSTIQKSQAHSDDGVAHAEGEVVGRISCDYMVTLGSRSDWKLPKVFFVTLAVSEPGDRYSFFVRTWKTP